MLKKYAIFPWRNIKSLDWKYAIFPWRNIKSLDCKNRKENLEMKKKQQQKKTLENTKMSINGKSWFWETFIVPNFHEK